MHPNIIKKTKIHIVDIAASIRHLRIVLVIIITCLLRMWRGRWRDIERQWLLPA